MLAAPQHPDIIQYGTYTLPQASRLARVHARTVSYWFDDDPARGPAIKRHMPKNEDDLISFVDLIQLVGVHTVRNKHDVSLQRIRQAVRKAESMGISFPFARVTVKAYLFGGEIVLETAEGDTIQATGKHARGYLMKPIVLPYLSDLTADPNGLPIEYRPIQNILLTPKRHFGAPIVESCDYAAQTLVSAVEAEGSIEAAADMCGVSVDEVRSALRYEEYLSGIAA